MCVAYAPGPTAKGNGRGTAITDAEPHGRRYQRVTFKETDPAGKQTGHPPTQCQKRHPWSADSLRAKKSGTTSLGLEEIIFRYEGGWNSFVRASKFRLARDDGPVGLVHGEHGFGPSKCPWENVRFFLVMRAVP